ncbi:MAG: hypothetical protein WCX31_22395, partial [Salinivirgaceae bacterium]
IEKTAQLIQEITAASVEQSNGAEQVNVAIQQVNSVTQQNAAASEELASSSEEMASQAEQLSELVSFFKIDDKTNKQTGNKNFQKKDDTKRLIIKTDKQVNRKAVNLNMFTSDNVENEFTAY